MKNSIVVADRVSAEEIGDPHPEDPAVGKWYWLRLDGWEEEVLSCVVHVGTNFLKMKTVSESSHRVHVKDFFDVCRHEPDPDTRIDGRVAEESARIATLMDEIRSVTARLGVGPSLALPGKEALSEARALAVIGGGAPIGDYRRALIKAKDETLPDLFEKVKHAHEQLATWMTAKLIPMKAQSRHLDENIEKIESRIFSVELYAGLSEQVETIRSGEPAAMAEPVHLMQRRAYMDEECLAQYETGGMDFQGIAQFDAWLARPSNLDRILPHPKCVIAFRVRRHGKTRDYVEDEYVNIFEYVNIVLKMEEADKYTFLYIRNGDQLYRLDTKIEFGSKLFPDVNNQPLNVGRKLYAKEEGGREWTILTEDEYLAIKKEAEDQIAEDEEKRKAWRARRKPMTAAERRADATCEPHVHSWWDRDRYHPYNQDSVFYDDITKQIRRDLERHTIDSFSSCRACSTDRPSCIPTRRGHCGTRTASRRRSSCTTTTTERFPRARRPTSRRTATSSTRRSPSDRSRSGSRSRGAPRRRRRTTSTAETDAADGRKGTAQGRSPTSSTCLRDPRRSPTSGRASGRSGVVTTTATRARSGASSRRKSTASST